MTGTQIVDRLVAVAEDRQIRTIHGDQRESLMLRAQLAERGLSFQEHPWTSSNKPKAVERLRRLMADGLLSLDFHAKLRRELANFEERITTSGQFTYSARRGGHDDFVALLITAMIADIEGELVGNVTQLNLVQRARLSQSRRWDGMPGRGFG